MWVGGCVIVYAACVCECVLFALFKINCLLLLWSVSVCHFAAPGCQLCALQCRRQPPSSDNAAAAAARRPLPLRGRRRPAGTGRLCRLVISASRFAAAAATSTSTRTGAGRRRTAAAVVACRLSLLLRRQTLLAAVRVRAVLAVRLVRGAALAAGRTGRRRRAARVAARVRCEAGALLQIDGGRHVRQLRLLVLEHAQPFARQLWPAAHRLVPHHREVGFAAEVLRDGHGFVQIEDDVPPAARHEHSFAGFLQDFQLQRTENG